MPEIEKNLRPIDLAHLNPPLNPIVVTDTAGLVKLKIWLESKVAAEVCPEVGLDTETNCVDDFWFRRVRLIQIGDRNTQFIIDLLAFAGSEQMLQDSQGNYGVRNGDIYKPILDVLDPVVCTNKFLKVGQNLGFEYQVFNWSFGRRIWHLYSTDLAERVIQAGAISLKRMTEFSMPAIAARHFGLLIDKNLQKSFDLKSPLTQDQINYAAFDVRFPFAMKESQMKMMTRDQLLAVAQIENDAIGTFQDMHLVGQNLDDERWKKRLEHVIARRAEELRILDAAFIPIVGKKNEQIDQVELDRLESIWRNNFEKPAPIEVQLAAAKRLEKNPEKKAQLAQQLKDEELKRRMAKSEARAAYSELSKKRTKILANVEKCSGNAFLNYDSQPQMLEALKKLPNIKGIKNIQDVSDETLLRFNDHFIIQTLRSYKKGKKDTGTYGLAWVQQWITKPLAKEGWRHPGDGRLHCIFNQLEAETGRTSSEKPNGQNLPKDDEVRACFITSPPTEDEPDGFDIITVDMEGAELRIIAELADAKSWITAFAKKQDVHSVSTEILYLERWPTLALSDCAYYEKDENGEPKRQKCKCPEHKKLRDNTKATNFLLAYGGGPSALADAIGKTLDEAKELMKLHEDKFPDIWSYLRRSGVLAKQDRQARDMFGRRRLFPEPTREMAIAWFKEEKADQLLLSDEEIAAAVDFFKRQNLREPNRDEMDKLSHRNPTEKEINQGWRALEGSIERRGKNHCIQSTNASIIKRSMGAGFDRNGKPYLWHILPQYKAHIVSMVHDELVLECPKRFSQQVALEVSEAFTRAAAEVMKKVKMTADFNIANRWVK